MIWRRLLLSSLPARAGEARWQVHDGRHQPWPVTLRVTAPDHGERMATALLRGHRLERGPAFRAEAEVWPGLLPQDVAEAFLYGPDQEPGQLRITRIVSPAAMGPDAMAVLEHLAGVPVQDAGDVRAGLERIHASLDLLVPPALLWDPWTGEPRALL